MDQYKVILKDGTEVGIVEATLAPTIVVLTETKEDMMTVWGQLSHENLAEIKVCKNDVEINRFYDVVLDGTQSVVNSDGTLTNHFYMHSTASGSEATEDDEYIRAAKILLGEED